MTGCNNAQWKPEIVMALIWPAERGRLQLLKCSTQVHPKVCSAVSVCCTIPINYIKLSPQYFQYYEWDTAKVTIRMGVHVSHLFMSITCSCQPPVHVNHLFMSITCSCQSPTPQPHQHCTCPFSIRKETFTSCVFIITHSITPLTICLL